MARKFSKECIKDVTEQIINMLDNDILQENGGESLEGWCENGEVFELNGCDDREVDERMTLVQKINHLVTDLVWELDVTRLS